MALKIHVHEYLEGTSGDGYPSQHTCVRCGGVDDEPLMSRIDGEWVCDDCADDYRKEMERSKHVHNKAVGYEAKSEAVPDARIKLIDVFKDKYDNVFVDVEFIKDVVAYGHKFNSKGDKLTRKLKYPQVGGPYIESGEGTREYFSKEDETKLRELIKKGLSLKESVDKRSLKNRLYKALRPINGKYYRDENGQAIQDFKQIVNGIIEEPLRLDVFVFDGGYRTSKDGYTHWKEYDFEIYDSTTNKNIIDGKITCGAAGTVEDPFSRYDVTITMY